MRAGQIGLAAEIERQAAEDQAAARQVGGSGHDGQGAANGQLSAARSGKIDCAGIDGQIAGDVAVVGVADGTRRGQ